MEDVETGETLAVSEYEKFPTCSMIEEFMLLANIAVVCARRGVIPPDLGLGGGGRSVAVMIMCLWKLGSWLYLGPRASPLSGEVLRPSS